ncbi:unnamed protein product, partial [Mycena citricolor]
MKLGGKAAAVVLGDADLEMAASQHVLGAFMKASQMRMGVERIIVQEPIEDQFFGEQRKNSNLLTRCLPSSYRLRTKQLGSPTTANVDRMGMCSHAIWRADAESQSDWSADEFHSSNHVW